MLKKKLSKFSLLLSFLLASFLTTNCQKTSRKGPVVPQIGSQSNEKPGDPESADSKQGEDTTSNAPASESKDSQKEETPSSEEGHSTPQKGTTTQESPWTSPYQVFYGNLHNHTARSDGKGTPEQAYTYARDKAGLDFFGLSDHDYYPDNMTKTDWVTIVRAANLHNEKGSFVTFWGFEWTNDSASLGHFTVVIDPRSAAGPENDFGFQTDFTNTEIDTPTLNDFSAWLAPRKAIAIFNHPGQYDTTFDGFDFEKAENIVGMELWNRTSGFSYYDAKGYYKDDNMGYFDEALSRGWKIGATGGFDNHRATWGRRSDYRMAVLATEKSRAALFDAFKERRFFSTADKNLWLSFTGNKKEMGSVLTTQKLSGLITALDKDGEVFSKIQLLGNGKVIKEWQPNEKRPQRSFTREVAPDDYFYVIVTQKDGDRAISSPIFIQ